MRFSPVEEQIALYEEGFGEDILGRKNVGKALSEVLERIEDPLVVVLDGNWGAGKTHFLRRWVGAHKGQFGGRATTVYFDAFAHDYLDDPLIALIGAMSERFPSEKTPKLEKVKQLALRFWKPAARIGLSVATFGATNALDELGDAVANAVGDEAKQAVDQFWHQAAGRRAAMEDFHDAITSLMTPDGTDGEVVPLIIVIDELDRCRPDYALQVLEVIKHFFSVPSLHFVLGVNLTALQNSVKARYGSDINAGLYLQKFISLTLSLPEVAEDQERTPATVIYARHVGCQMKIPDALVDALANHLKVVAAANQVTIRDVSRVLSRISLLPEHVLTKRYLAGWIEVMLTLLVSKEVRPDLYPKFRGATAGPEEIASYFGAKPENTTQRINEGWNQQYSHEIVWRQMSWLYVTQDGKLPDQEDARTVAQLFSTHFAHTNPRNIPERINRDWLDLFKIQ